MNRFENRRPSETEIESGLANIEQFIEGTSAELKTEGIPLRPDGRIDMRAYRALYDSVDRDIASAGENQPDAEALREKRLRTDGERLEMLALAVFRKSFGRDFVVTRSASHDDRVNKVDTVILERATGNLVCAFDEVSSTAGVDLEKKQEAVMGRNVKEGGATLKYGLRLVEDEKGKKIVPGDVSNVPIFYVALPKDRIEEGLKEFAPSTAEETDYEKKLFEYFISAIMLQVKGLELYDRRLNPALRQRLQNFKKVVDSLRERDTRAVV